MRLALVLSALLAVAAPARALNPMDAVHAFCRADGRGERLLARTWINVAPLIRWGLEPGWDRVVLIESYEVAEPRYHDNAHAEVTVTYYVAVDVEGDKVTREPRQEKHTFHLVADESGKQWGIVGPPAPPHVFLIQVDPEEMAASLDPDAGTFLTSSTFARGFINGAGWELSPFTVSDIPALAELSQVTTPALGDLVLYYDGKTPYHVGVLEAEDAVLSATLNGGIRRAPVAAFAGKVRYWRPRASARALTPTPAKAPPKAKVKPAAKRPRTR
jgi:hypothetical protein